MEKYYEIAGVEISVSGNDKEFSNDERLLKDFKLKDVNEPYRFHFSLEERLDEPTGVCIYKSPSVAICFDGNTEIRYIGSVQNSLNDAYLRTEKTGKRISVQVLYSKIADKITSKLILNSLAMERLALEGDGVVLHASYVVWNGRAILFTAPSGTGKSTQANLWSELRGAEIINGDRAVIRRANGLIFACGLPFAGSSEYCKNVTAPLMAIVYLGQSNDTQIQKLSGGMAFRRVWEGCSVASWCSEDVEKAMSIVQDVTAHVPVYYLNCTPDESAVAALENELRKGDK